MTHANDKLPLLIFDLGGVLVHIRYDRFLERLGLNDVFDEKKLLTLLMPEGILYESGQLSSEDFYRRVKEQLGGEISFGEFHDAWNAILADPIVGMEQVVSSVAKQTEVYLLSNTNDLHFRFAMKRFPVLELLDGYFLSYQIGAMKPSRKIYERVLRALDEKGRTSLFIDDQDRNIHAAQEAGMEGIVFSGVDELIGRLRARGFEI